MLIFEGVVTKCGLEAWKNETTKESGESFRFAIEGMNLIVDNSIDPSTLPDVGHNVRAMVNRIYSQKKKREYFFVLGFQSMNGSGSHSE